MAQEKIKISPEVCTYNSEDDKKLIIEVEVPGVDGKDIDLRMLDDSFTLGAAREDLEYTLALSLCCPVKADATKAEYHNGLLRIEAPYRDFMENAVRIKVA
ncbi:MAG: Hsp20/alpha crystallin family protein [Spirochaetes bacterium]|nr:Hsp20/alpha crystallin family protein [Spirochaetota bacterium]